MKTMNRGSMDLGRLERRHGLERLHSAVERWIAKAHYSFVENLRLETASSPAVRGQTVERWIAKAHHSFVENLQLETASSPVVRRAGRPGPNVKEQLDPRAAGRRDSHCAQSCPTGATRDSNPRQTTWDGCHWPTPAERGACPVRLMAPGPSRRSYPDDRRWLADAVPVAWRVKPTGRDLRSRVNPTPTSGNLAYRSDDHLSADPPLNGCFPADAVRNA
jgi:hypothetical protein